ncbi:50S ribosomal protein L31 [Candidatus Falkowbacteria bacterium CG10_big_fil_rev_8_21_14_0_10_37_14]|uniref:50S ribosomal protein L31 n=1 Tax=Candidatus Falkowbacteria bacterium CG10_big_fil_rev_8_21_14_0_10_37_14 TaxID=1974561 RepID=A0A2M6WST2_9BACT|nr:MAG: 50S ribosomal protein L31 [Candidatus Falkowbacteria bacterium CG10_big_fil_rev_8_21_14_0_10_37_14]
MKKTIPPAYSAKAEVICACGNTFQTGSTSKEIKTELCSACHPFYTGKQKLVDTARRVEKFKAKLDVSSQKAIIGAGKKAKQAARSQARNNKNA